MNILYSAFACNPYTGSEANCGWSFAYAMSKVNSIDNIYLLTRYENKPYIERFIKENGTVNIKFLYCDVPEWMNLYIKYGKFYFIYYKMWQKAAYKFVKNKVGIKFDIIHHITLGDFRIIGKLWKIKGCKFIFGPVGGAQETPKCLKIYTSKNKKQEYKRKLINNFMKVNIFYKNALNKCCKIYCANEETLRFIQNCLKNKNNAEIMTENGISLEYIKNVERIKRVAKDNEKIRIMWAGRMIYRKGLELLLEVIKEVKCRNKFEVYLLGSGPQKQELETYIKENNLEEKVILKGKCEYLQMQQEYKNADIFIFPSIRETTGTVLFEAMANGLPIISLKQNGAKKLVTDKTGVLVKIDNQEQVKMDLKLAIEELVDNAEKRMWMGQNARKEIEEKYTWENKCKIVIEKYKEDL